MDNSERNIFSFMRSALRGMGVIVLSLISLIVFLWICIIVVRVVMG